jgi:flavin-dependent dehydrogenase
MRTHDVIVVGGRVAGAATALLLARAGLDVAVVDRSRRGSDTVSTHGLMRAGVLQLSRWGLLPQVIAAGTPAIRTTVFHHEDVEPMAITIRPTPGVDALYAPRRNVLDGIILDAAEDAGATVYESLSVTSLLRTTGDRVAGVAGRTRGGAAAMLAARLVVGADGAASTVARDSGAAVTRRGRAASAVLYGYVGGLPAAGYEWAYGARAAAGLLPTNAGEVCVFVATDRDRMRIARRNGTAGAFRGLLREVSAAMAERVEGAALSGPLRGWGGMPGLMRRPYGPGWALVGDAGSYRDPISTHGMTDALRDAELLATGILESFAGAAAERVALRAYERKRDALSIRLFDAVDRVAAYDWDTAGIGTLLRAVSSAMTDEVDELSALPAPALLGGTLASHSRRY